MTPATSRRAAARAPAPWIKTSAECALDALIVAAAVILAAGERPGGAARLCLMDCAQRSGLVGTPPRRDLLAELDVLLGRFRADHLTQRRVLVGTMNLLVGSPWARLVLEAAEQMVRAIDPPDPQTESALRALRLALALPTAAVEPAHPPQDGPLPLRTFT